MNYILEGNTNFTQILITELCKDNTSKCENVCLISNDPLEKNHITLTCNHHFNYNDIFEEVCRQKKKRNTLEIDTVGTWPLKCPYCRNMQDGILPYIYKYKRVLNVNWPPNQSYSKKYCEYVLKSGKRKGASCQIKCLNQFCYRHEKKKNIIKKICKAILKTGKRKGQTCSYSSSGASDFCKIHTPKKDNK